MSNLPGILGFNFMPRCDEIRLKSKQAPKSLLSWQRVRVANQMAKNGPEWGDYSMRYNSGTYNNQYMIIDTNLFTVGEPLKDNTLTVVEQMPNNVAVGDQFGVLNHFYHSS